MLSGQRITLVSTFAPADCGIASYSQYLAQALLDEDPGVRLAVVTTSGGPGRTIGRLEIVPGGSMEADYPATIAQAVTDTRPDIVHIQHEYGIFGADERFPCLLSMLTELGLPVVVTMHTVHTNLSVDLGCGWTKGFSMQGVGIEPYQHVIGQLANVVVVHHDQAIRRPLIRQGLAGHDVVVIPHGTLCVDQPAVLAEARAQIPSGRPLLVAPGYLRPSKNVEMLIEAFAAIADDYPDAVLWIGGHLRPDATAARTYLDGCREKADRYGVLNRLIVAERPISEAAMSGILAAADLVLCVYDEDTRSVSGIAHRAIGAGAVVVVSRRPKFQEFAEVCDELLVDPDRPAELARLVRRLLDDDAFRGSVRRSLRGLAEETAWPLVARRHLDTYARLGATMSRLEPVGVGAARGD